MERFGLTVSGQLSELIRFAAVGVLLGAWYDVFRFVRLITRPGAWRIFLEDIFFFATSAAAVFLASLCICYGDIRLFHLPATVVGFAVYYHTVGRILYRIERLLADALQRVWSVVARFVKKTVRHLFAFLKKVFENCKNRLHVGGEV